ncbi:TlpA family protein disulfide reductase [Salipaludibacillus keqinensis]|nr:TlpA disulfide reductase family protein [Salipaludibacillus keqinensis]
MYSSNEWIVVEKAMSTPEEESSKIMDGLEQVKVFTIDEQEISLSELHGERRFVFFFTSWCQVCAEQWNEVKIAQKELENEGVDILAINLTQEERNGEDVRDYIEQVDAEGIDVVLDTNGDAQKQFRVFGIPTSFMVSEQGEIEGRTDGLVSAEKIIEKIKSGR